MKKIRNSYLVILLLLISVNTYGRIGIRAGINTSNEFQLSKISTPSDIFKSENLTGYQVGLVYQYNPLKSGFGFDFGALLSQKGGVFHIDNNDPIKSIITGYHEINYVEAPVNFRAKLHIANVLSLYGTAGIYGAYALNEKTVLESDIDTLLKEESFDSFLDRIDYGYSFGGGIEIIKKLQIGISWNQGLQKRDSSKSIMDKVFIDSGSVRPNLEKNSISSMSITLTYLF
jgi:hypothetical protein